MIPSGPERRDSEERRWTMDRRSGEERRCSEPAAGLGAPPERRLGDRRSTGERRALLERRLALHSAEDQIRGALKLLTQLADGGGGGAMLGDQQRRSLEAAMLRLRFALERMEGGA